MISFLIRPETIYLTMMFSGMIIFRKKPRRDKYILRLIICFVLFSVANCFIWHLYPIEFGITSGILYDVLFVTYMLLIISESLISFLICYRCDFLSALFVTSICYAYNDLQGHVRSLLNLTDLFISENGKTYFTILMAVLTLLSTVFIVYFIMRKFDLWEVPLNRKDKVIYSLSINIIGLILARFVSYIPSSTTLTIVISIYGLLCDIFLLIGSYITMGIRQKDRKINEIDTVLKKEYKTSKMNEEAIKELSMFAHDWKNSIYAYKMGEEAISNYETIIQTGNRALDIILDEKNKICKKNNITLKVMVDGKKLDFMSDYDICSLFGNALDNAIEGCLQVDEHSDRYILLKMDSSLDMPCFVIENSASHKVDIDKEGKVKTTKKDASMHGFGIESMKKICSSYGGSLRFVSEETSFKLILILN